MQRGIDRGQRGRRAAGAWASEVGCADCDRRHQRAGGSLRGARGRCCERCAHGARAPTLRRTWRELRADRGAAQRGYLALELGDAAALRLDHFAALQQLRAELLVGHVALHAPPCVALLLRAKALPRETRPRSREARRRRSRTVSRCTSSREGAGPGEPRDPAESTLTNHGWGKRHQAARANAQTQQTPIPARGEHPHAMSDQVLRPPRTRPTHARAASACAAHAPRPSGPTSWQRPRARA